MVQKVLKCKMERIKHSLMIFTRSKVNSEGEFVLTARLEDEDYEFHNESESESDSEESSFESESS